MDGLGQHALAPLDGIGGFSLPQRQRHAQHHQYSDPHGDGLLSSCVISPVSAAEANPFQPVIQASAG
jgi:hypothetical protein